jgi:hypothetical protein
MSDENPATPTGTESQQAAPAEQPSSAPPAITMEQIQSMVEEAAKKARDSAFAEARRMFQGKSKDEAPPKQKDSNQPASTQPDQNRARERAFDRAVAKLELTDSQFSDLEVLFANASTDNVAEWVATKAQSLGLTGQKSATAATAAATPNPAQAHAAQTAPQPRTPPQSDQGAPQAIPVWERPSDPFQWTEEDYNRLVALKGRREAQKITRRKAEEYASGIRLQLTGRR